MANRPARAIVTGRKSTGLLAEANRIDNEGSYTSSRLLKTQLSGAIQAVQTNLNTVTTTVAANTSLINGQAGSLSELQAFVVANLLTVNSGIISGFPINKITFTGSGVTLTVNVDGSVVVHVAGSGAGTGLLSWITPPNSADWSWVNQGSATLTTGEHGGMVLYMPGPTAGSNYPILTKPVPGSSPYKIDFGITPTALDIATAGFVCGLYDSGSSKMSGFAISQRGGALYNGLEWNWFTTPLGPVTNKRSVTDGMAWGTVRFCRIENDGANINGYVSADGEAWLKFWTEAVGANVTPTDSFIGLFALNSCTDSFATFLHFAQS